MELTHFDIEAMSVKPHKLQLKHPFTSEPIDSFIDVISAKSAKFKRLMLESSKTVKDGASEQEMELKGAGLLACLIVGWENIELNGEKLEHTEETAVKMMVDYSWIADQVLLAANDESFFFKDCPSS
tara:strand:+ start:1979 stop:2359 length:381 start_codon:yes stop_codon:yes gene_type:complete